jgi:hypothetical protein
MWSTSRGQRSRESFPATFAGPKQELNQGWRGRDHCLHGNDNAEYFQAGADDGLVNVDDFHIDVLALR